VPGNTSSSGFLTGKSITRHGSSNHVGDGLYVVCGGTRVPSGYLDGFCILACFRSTTVADSGLLVMSALLLPKCLLKNTVHRLPCELAQVVDDSLGQFGYHAPVSIADSAVGVLPRATHNSAISSAMHGGWVQHHIAGFTAAPTSVECDGTSNGNVCALSGSFAKDADAFIEVVLHAGYQLQVRFEAITALLTTSSTTTAE
jgi:hypothetical protein